MKKIIVMLLALVALCGCQKEEFEGFDMPFVKVTTTTGASQTVVLSNVNNINTYVVSVSSKMLTTALVVNYEIVVGDGLQEGVDYELVTTGNQLTFEPGIYDMPIRIKWLAYEKSVRDLGKETMDTIVEIILDTDHSGHDCTLERL